MDFIRDVLTEEDRKVFDLLQGRMQWQILRMLPPPNSQAFDDAVSLVEKYLKYVRTANYTGTIRQFVKNIWWPRICQEFNDQQLVIHRDICGAIMDD